MVLSTNKFKPLQTVYFKKLEKNGTDLSTYGEKTSRIVEVMISTVKPHELMFGKILGVGLVGLFQIIIWCVTTPLFIWLISSVFMSGASMTMPQGPGAAAMNPDMANNVMAGIFSQLSAINWWMLIPLLFLFFLLGYLMYSSLFAAIGSTMGDDQGEGQSLTFLVIMPLLFGFYISISAIKAPNSSLAVWSSQIPFFSPIVMPVRLAFDPPGWQIATSLFILSLSALFFAWLSSRIYRVYEGMWHNFQMFNQVLDTSSQALDEIAGVIKGC